MDDFGKILDQWESGARAPNERRRVDMESLLDRYPPQDKDAERESEAGDNGHSRPGSKERPDRIPPDDSLDLHGYRLQEAIAATEAFLASAVENGYRKVVIIHGKGEGGQGILRREIRQYLEQHPMTGTMGYNRGVDGGRGALWVLLRKKSADG
jgi:DNA-nicking Smr family endonuclease